MEVITFGARSTKPPLLFVHGSYCGAWIWSRYFLPAFEKAGWWGSAISLRGHGNSEGSERIDTFGIADYLDDIDQGVTGLGETPVLIGHSLGGYLIQKYALEKEVKGLVLLSSPSLLGLNGSMQHIATKSPLLGLQLGILMTLGPEYADLDTIGKSLFHGSTVSEDVLQSLEDFQRESKRVAVEASFPDFRTPPHPVPTLALGGGDDAFVPEFEFRYEAHFWEGKSKVLQHSSHGIMLDDNWPNAAREIMGWLGTIS